MALVFQICFIVYGVLRIAEGHAWLEQPPGRSSAWRLGFPTPRNYNDNELNCGGFDNQHNVEGGKCGLCGDPFGGPRSHEPGPSNQYAAGVIVANYTQGQSIAVKIRITAPHKGYHEFRLCKNDIRQEGLKAAVAAQCVPASPNFPLLASPDGRLRFDELDPAIVLRLPADVKCEACILQWRWRTGNRWGCDADGCGMGFGNQEEFYGCADVRIVASPKAGLDDKSQANGESPTTAAPKTVATQSSATVKKPLSTLPAKTIPPSDTKTNPNDVGQRACVAVPPYKEDVAKWCNVNCNLVPPYCPASHCRC